jgi:WD40 repeat protein
LQLLLSVGKDEDHSLAVYRWADHTRLFSARLHKVQTHQSSYYRSTRILSFNPHGQIRHLITPVSVAVPPLTPALTFFSLLSSSQDGVFDARFASAGYSFATCNASGVHFWLPKGSGEVREWGRQKGVFGKKAPQPIVALSAFVQPTHMLAGTATGTSGHRWKERGRKRRAEGRGSNRFLVRFQPFSILRLEADDQHSQPSFSRIWCVPVVCAGELLLWEGRSLVQSVCAHDGILTLISLHPPTSTVLTAAKDRKVKRWNTKLEPLVVIDLLLLSSSVDPLVRGASLSVDGRVLLLGTRGGEIFEVAAQNGPPPAEGDETEPLRAGVDLNNGALVAGHVKGRVHCLATHASGEMVSGGQDGSLRTWDLASHRPKKVAGFDAPIACVAYSPADATLVALALGPGKEGTLILWGLEAAAEVATFRDTAGVINDVKISNDGSSLAAASEDGSVYLYKSEGGVWGLKGELRGWAGGVKRVDFSADGQFLRGDSDLSENEDRPLRVFSLEAMEEVAALNTLRDSEWASETCLHTYGTQGLTLSPLQPKVGSVHKASAAPLLVSASEGSGRLRLLSYPAVSGKGGAKAFAGHGGQVSSVRFAPNDSHVLSAGERAVFQWALEVDEGNDSSDELEPEEAVEEEEEEEDEDGRPIVRPPPESDAEEDYVDGQALERPVLVQAVRGQEWGPMLEMKEAAGEGLFPALRGFAPQALPKKGAAPATHKVRIGWFEHM